VTHPTRRLTLPTGRPGHPQVTECEAGASMLSAMIAVVLMATVFGLGARAVWGAIGATDRLSETARFQATIARFDAELVVAAARIRQPIWLARGRYHTTGDGLVVSYLDGDSMSEISLRWDEEGARLLAGDALSAYRGLSIAEASVDPHPPAHLVVKIETGFQTLITVTAPFALFPLPQP